MLEKPELPDRRIVTCVQKHYGLRLRRLVFLPLGVDQRAAVYRAEADDDAVYFVKLRRGPFHAISVLLPQFLHDRGVEQIIAPLATTTGRLYTTLDNFAVVLYPFVEGRNGYEMGLADQQWIEFGTTVRRIHTIDLPSDLHQRIPQEHYSDHWRATVKGYLARMRTEKFADPVSEQTATLMQTHRTLINDLVQRAEELVQELRTTPHEQTLCHADLHAGNLHIVSAEQFFIVDWDQPLLAPKERDLMSIGGGLMGNHDTAQHEETLFYRGYGQVCVDPVPLAYYRYERIIQDIAEFCDQIFGTGAGPDREQSLRYLRSHFAPQGTLARAYGADRTR